MPLLLRPETLGNERRIAMFSFTHGYTDNRGMTHSQHYKLDQRRLRKNRLARERRAAAKKGKVA